MEGIFVAAKQIIAEIAGAQFQSEQYANACAKMQHFVAKIGLVLVELEIQCGLDAELGGGWPVCPHGQATS